MNETQNRIVRMEEDAGRLVDELAALKREVGSYKAATTELEKTQAALGNFLGATQELAREIYKLIQTTNTIGGAKILEHLEIIERAIEDKGRRDHKAKILTVSFLAIILVVQIFLLLAVKSRS